MGQSTKVYIPKIGSVNDMVNKIIAAIKEKMNVYGDITSSIDNHPQKDVAFKNYEAWRILFALDNYSDQFESKKEQRILWVYWDYEKEQDLLYISFNVWGDNKGIAITLVDTFGGYADFNDCDDVQINYAMPEPI